MLLRSFVYVKVSVGSLTAQAAGSPGSVTIPCAGLDHPRTLMGNFNEIERALKEALHQLGTREWYKRPPITLIHLLPKAEGAYTNVELRAFQESALGAGSAKAYMLVDHAPLTVVNHAEMKKHFTKPAF